MKQKAEPLRKRIAKLQAELEQAENALDAIERNCNHEYGPEIYDPIHHKERFVPFDSPKIVGDNVFFGSYYAARTEKRWKKECERCGRVEYRKEVDPIKEMIKEVQQGVL